MLGLLLVFRFRVYLLCSVHFYQAYCITVMLQVAVETGSKFEDLQVVL